MDDAVFLTTICDGRDDLEDAITQYKLVYSDMASCTTDTEPVMVKLGRLIKEKARSARSDDISMDHHGL